jgi:hypothetical protein
LDEFLKDGTLTLALEFSYEKKQYKSWTVDWKAIEKDNIRNVYKQRKFTDVSLQFGDKSIKAHKALMAGCSSLLNDRLNELPENSNVLDLHDLGVEFEVANRWSISCTMRKLKIWKSMQSHF